jgi:formate-dependent nitrite reductase cytochrome c552 subunit
MGQRSSFAAMKAEQARMTESWKAEGRQSEAWVIADPEIVEIFSAGVSFGMEMGRRRDGAYTQDEWRRALRQAVERAAELEVKLEKAKEGMRKKE